MTMGFRGASSIQSGADLAWDIFLFLGMTMPGVVIERQESDIARAPIILKAGWVPVHDRVAEKRSADRD
jgi:hypothetical protein